MDWLRLASIRGKRREKAKKRRRRKDSGNRREVEGKKRGLTVSTESCNRTSLHINIPDQEVLKHSTAGVWPVREGKELKTHFKKIMKKEN